MGRLKFAVVTMVALACATPARAVVGETTVKVAEGTTAIPQATITVTFKSQAGTPLPHDQACGGAQRSARRNAQSLDPGQHQDRRHFGDDREWQDRSRAPAWT